jgi:hypothetical protein
MQPQPGGVLLHQLEEDPAGGARLADAGPQDGGRRGAAGGCGEQRLSLGRLGFDELRPEEVH